MIVVRGHRRAKRRRSSNGYDPRIHLLKTMDCRIKSGNDEKKGLGIRNG
jgi:hypothetical protein